MVPDGSGLEMPWLRSQLVEWLVKLADRSWQEANWAVVEPGYESLDDMWDFFDDKGLDRPEMSLGLLLKDQEEVDAIRELEASFHSVLQIPAEGADLIRSEGWGSVIAAARRALRVLAANDGAG
ncbi:hypothetical protein ACFWU3_34615 [Streptomyces sp. NPDC058685]|uniref:SCO4402 family protein n=1 Tax=Streptomyces sp. NPDC058685 TaxID=3346598 RepID=UPI003661B39E